LVRLGKAVDDNNCQAVVENNHQVSSYQTAVVISIGSVGSAWAWNIFSVKL